MTARPGGARVVDLPAGYRDDPPGQAGRAALLAAVLSDPRCGGAPARAAAEGWRTRHRLDERCSSFAYWSPRPAGAAAVLDEIRRTRLPAGSAGESVLAELRARQAAAIEGRHAAPLALIGRALERAAWGAPGHGLLGTPGTLAAVSTTDLAEAHELLVSQATVYHSESEPAGSAAPAPRPARRDWRGGLDVAAHPGADARVGVRLPVRDSPPEVLELLVEVLGTGPDGRMHRALRHHSRLAYGFTVACWPQPGSASIGATATVAPQHAAAAVRVLATTLRQLADGAGAAETGLARWRCRAGLLAELDGPFGAVLEARRHARGERGARQRLAAMARIDTLPGLAFAPLPPAVAAVGAFHERHRAELADVYEEIR
ncbi:hypothetical protein [Actinoplanes sp. NPDC049118]|uniref:hypothetical protein n=1 Tax=Actinoplanes sp. NPDC049118 TaxID=3155769 RepID=UPI0034065C6B